MESTVTCTGRILFDPDDVSRKHEKQSAWKLVAMVIMNDDTADYYSWFIRRRYGLVLNKPLRGSHVTFINDRSADTNGKWEDAKRSWNGRSVKLSMNLDVRTNAEFWWLRILPCSELTEIRKELGLGDPFFPFHLTIGYPNEKNEAHSRYIHGLLTSGLAT